VPAGAYARERTAELFDPALGLWIPTGSMNVRRSAASATLLPDGEVLLVGGYDATRNAQVISTELYSPAANNWRLTGSMATGRASHTAIVMDSGAVLVAGGVRDGAGPLTSAEEYVPLTGRWTPEPSMSCPPRLLRDATPGWPHPRPRDCGTSSGAEVFRP
jgi:N-acetylneuraminic acid mutarotase